MDGDVYNVTTVTNLIPRRTYLPASYEPAQKKLVDHDSTMADVAEFVAEYITSDVSKAYIFIKNFHKEQANTKNSHPDAWNNRCHLVDHSRSEH